MGIFDSILDFAGSDVGQAGLKIGGQLIASGLGSSAAEKAAQLQTQASQEGIAEQARQFDVTQGNLNPFIDAATRGVVSQQAGIGLLGNEAQQQFFDEFQQSPGQQYIRDQQEQALIRNSAATGGLGGGRVQTALQGQAANFANQTFGTHMNRLAAITGSGQTAATNLGGIGQQAAVNTGNLLTNQGQAGAAGVMGQNQAVQQGVQGITQAIGGLF